MSEKENMWQAGQLVALNRRQVVPIKRVTPSGRAVIDWHGTERFFSAGGYERKAGYSNSRIAALTPEIEDEIQMANRTQHAFSALVEALRDGEKWERNNHPRWGHDLAEPGAVEIAERLAAAIRGALP